MLATGLQWMTSDIQNSCSHGENTGSIPVGVTSGRNQPFFDCRSMGFAPAIGTILPFHALGCSTSDHLGFVPDIARNVQVLESSTTDATERSVTPEL